MPDFPIGRLLLHGGGDVTSAFEDTCNHLGSPRSAIFLPYALHDHEGYTASVQDRLFGRAGIAIRGLHTCRVPSNAIAEADAIIVGGGNSFRLVRALHERELIEPVRRAVASGVPYWGASAGSNVACPTIRTTNDMPIIESPSLSSFGLIPFQINPHYVDPLPLGQQVGETRERRIQEFLEENAVTVVGLRENSWLLIEGPNAQLRGTAPAVLFRRGADPREIASGSDVSFLLQETMNFDEPTSPSSP